MATIIFQSITLLYFCLRFVAVFSYDDPNISVFDIFIDRNIQEEPLDFM